MQRSREGAIAHRVRGPCQHRWDEIDNLNPPRVFFFWFTAQFILLLVFHLLYLSSVSNKWSFVLLCRKRGTQNPFLLLRSVCAIYRLVSSVEVSIILSMVVWYIDFFLQYFRKQSIVEYALVDQEFIDGDFLLVETFKKEKWYFPSLIMCCACHVFFFRIVAIRNLD